jgi:hypothetical protein
MHEPSLPRSTRRSFLAGLPLLAGVLGLRPSSLGAQAQRASSPLPGGRWDLSWLDSAKGKHRQVFSLGELQGAIGLTVVTNWLAAHEEVFGLKPPHVNAFVGISGKSIAINLADAMWAKYELGKRYNVLDPETNAPAVRNVYLHGRRDARGRMIGVEPLQARGVMFWQCNNALGNVAGQYAQSGAVPADEVRADLLASLNPGVKLIPAHTMVLGLAQERGFAYEQLG